MITRIELTNFMSHVHTVIEPAPGLTVLVGPNNCGKSAVVAALQIICQNANSTYVRRHETSECAVQVHTDDGHVIRWSRKKSGSPKYLIDGQPFDRLGQGGVPDELHAALRLPRVDGGDDADFDVHFGTQKSPIFLLGSSPANAARFFASSSDAIRLVQMQKRHKEKLAERQREKVRLEAESKQLNAELDALIPVAELERGLTLAEQRHAELQRLAQEMELAIRDRWALELEQQTTSRLASKTDALRALETPPELAPTEPLAIAAATLHAALQAQERAHSVQGAVERLPTPPPMEDTESLTAMASGIREWQQLADCGHARSAALQPLAAPPELAPVQPLQELLAKLTETEERLAECRARNDALANVTTVPQLADERELAESLRKLAIATSEFGRRQGAVSSLQVLYEPPGPQDSAPLASLIRNIEQELGRAAACHAALDTAEDELAEAAEKLRELAETSLCPTCGAPLDADRLLAAADAGHGGHQHG